MHKLVGLGANELEHLIIDQVLLCESDQSFFDLQKPANIKVLARLRHYSFIGSDDKQNNIDPACSGEHIFYEPLVSRNIHKPEPQIADFEIGKAKIDRNTAPFFIRQPVGICARQRLNKRRFTVVDMTGCTDNNVHIFEADYIRNGETKDLRSICSQRRRRRFSTETSSSIVSQ